MKIHCELCDEVFEDHEFEAEIEGNSNGRVSVSIECPNLCTIYSEYIPDTHVEE